MKQFLRHGRAFVIALIAAAFLWAAPPAPAAKLLFTNNAVTTVAAPVTSGATSMSVAAGTGVQFPTLGAGQYFRGTFVKSGDSTIFEIVKVTAHAGDVFTIVRSQESTSARSWSTGDSFTLLPTAADLSEFTQADDLQAAAGGYAPDTGSVNAYTVALAPVIAAHVTGMPIRWKALHGNTSTSTFNDGAGVAPLRLADGTDLVSGNIVAGGIYIATWDGTKFQFSPLENFNFLQIAGQVANGQVPLSAVQQFQASLSIGWGQLTGVKNADQVQGAGPFVTNTPNSLVQRDGSGTIQSPALSGIPTAPTAAPGTSTSQIATTAFVNQGALPSGTGYQVLPSGIVLEWGSIHVGDVASPPSGFVSFPYTFQSACFTVYTSALDNNVGNVGIGTTFYTSVFGLPSTTGFRWAAREAVSTIQDGYIEWFAIGR